METRVLQIPIKNASPPRRPPDRLWPLGESVTVLVGVLVAFYLGVVVGMLAYQSGWIEVVR